MSSIVMLPDSPSGCSVTGTEVQIQNSLPHKNQPTQATHSPLLTNTGPKACFLFNVLIY